MTVAPSRQTLIKTLWPDKAMYGAIMIFVTGVTGILWALIGSLIDMSYANVVPAFLRHYPPWLSVLLSGGAMAMAFFAMQHHRIMWAYMACALGFLSFAGLGVGPILSLIALVFVRLSEREREFDTPATRALTADMWPDKSLAASMLAFVTGVLSTFWGLLMLSGVVSWAGLSQAGVLYGVFAVVAGIVNLIAARGLYFQRGQRLGTVAAVMGILGFGFLLLGPLLSAANFVFIRWAIHEKEFDMPALREPLVRTA